MTPELEQQRLDEAVRAPAMIAALLAAKRAGLTIEQIGDPPESFRLASSALESLNPFTTDFTHNLGWLRDQGERVRASAQSVIAAGATAWWWAPIDPGRQVWTATEGFDPEPLPDRFIRPTLSKGDTQRTADRPSWEDYAHKPEYSIRTSSREAVGGTSFAFATHMMVLDILGPQEEIEQFAMPIAEEHRVFEVHGARDWHRLAMTYPRPVNLQTKGLQNATRRTVPDWGLIAEQWDGVHLSLGGLLLATEVSYETDQGLSRLWAWESEQTMWLRWVFGEPTRIDNAFPLAQTPRNSAYGYEIGIPRDPAFGSRPGDPTFSHVVRPGQKRGDQQG